MRLLRPYIPLSVRIAVAERQLRPIDPFAVDAISVVCAGEELKQYHLGLLLGCLRSELKTEALQLDHDPALALRKFNKRTGKYKPDANDPNYLKYRPADAHRTKTFLRGEHGQRSDIAQITRERKRSNPKKAKRKIQGRPMAGTKASGWKLNMDGTVEKRGG